jgi:hypothetical protein
MSTSSIYSQMTESRNSTKSPRSTKSQSSMPTKSQSSESKSTKSSVSGSRSIVKEEDPRKKLINCVRQISNFSSITLADRFDKPTFRPKQLLKKLAVVSPKMLVLLKNIIEIDNKDFEKHGKLFKHFIFSDVKGGQGAKIIASCLIASGYKIVMKPKGNNVVLDSELLEQKNISKFAVLTTSLWKNSIKEDSKKEILNTFNSRPENIHGDLFRFMIIDSNYKEGIDLFDVKHCHIFEDQLTDSDLTQAIGRGTRFCGQSGLRFSKSGWKLNVYNYKLFLPKARDLFKLRFQSSNELILDLVKKIDKELQFNINFNQEISNAVKDYAVDKLLNENINGTIITKKSPKKIIYSVSAIILAASTLISLLNRKGVIKFLDKIHDLN